jgi:hypothetical protein
MKTLRDYWNVYKFIPLWIACIIAAILGGIAGLLSLLFIGRD